MTRNSNGAVMYRPARGVGIGHLLSSLSGYFTVSQHLGLQFYFTVKNTVFELCGTETDFLTNYFDSDDLAFKNIAYKYNCFSDRIAMAEGNFQKIMVLGRSDYIQRSSSEFPALAGAKFMDYRSNINNLGPELLSKYDVLYFDSIIPSVAHVKQFGALRPLLNFSKLYMQKIFDSLRSRRYLAVHVRHGNGEYLDGRVSGDMTSFGGFVQRVAHKALEVSRDTGVEDIFVLSDNQTTAINLAKLTGGRTVGFEHLPTTRHADFIRSDREAAAARIEKIMFDLAVLAGAEHIVSGKSQFPRAAHLMSDGGTLTVVDVAKV